MTDTANTANHCQGSIRILPANPPLFRGGSNGSNGSDSNGPGGAPITGPQASNDPLPLPASLPDEPTTRSESADGRFLQGENADWQGSLAARAVVIG